MLTERAITNVLSAAEAAVVVTTDPSDVVVADTVVIVIGSFVQSDGFPFKEYSQVESSP
jgi:hypothetical protein